MIDLTLQDHVRVILSEYGRNQHLVAMSAFHCRELARRIAAHVQEVFLDAPDALPTEPVPGELPPRVVMTHALRFIERSLPAPTLFDPEYRTVTENLKAAIGKPG